MGDRDIDGIADRLAAFLEEALGRDGLEVRDLARLSGGASRETWSFDLLDALDGSTDALILQRIRVGTMGGAPSMEAESELLRAAARAGVPVAPVVAASDDVAIAGSPFLVMGRVEGETIARRLLRDDEFEVARSRLVGQCAAALAAIHAVPPSATGHLEVQEPISQLRGLIDMLGRPHPAFELGLRWLEAHRPPEVEPTLVHGDFRLGNLMVDEDGLAAVLDWELAHRGDPMEDLGWLCVRAWRFGSDLPVAGVGDYAELLAAYESASGTTLDPDVVHWWEVLGTLRWGVICVLQASTHLTGATRSVELAAIGRRVCENEYDVLGLLGARPDPGDRSEPAPVDADDRPADLHGEPTAAQLLEAVREFLEGDVMAATQGRVQFHARVAARVLATVERELALDGRDRVAHAARLASIGLADDADLAERIRSGTVTDWDAVTAVVWADVLAKLRVANPGYLLPTDR
ncbi:MAG: phosphotransferase family protein [Acidimicrobiales bacterium]